MKSDSNQTNFGMGSGPFGEEFLEELALERVLEARSEEEILRDVAPEEREALRALLSDASFLERVEDLRLWVGGAREQLADWKGSEDPGAAELSAQILAVSTRRSRFQEWLDANESVPEGLWGDAKILVGFVRRRLASSVALRVAAASLIAHLIALPALAAYIYWVRPDPAELVIRFDPNHPVLPDEIEGSAPAESLQGDSDLWSALGLEESNAIAVARYGLTHAHLEGRTQGMREPWADWVSIRLQRLQPGGRAPSLTAAPWETSYSLGQVFALELFLDDWVMGRAAPELPEEWWSPLLAWFDSEGTSDPAKFLVGHVLRRAEHYGLLPELDARLRSTIERTLGTPSEGEPLSPAWFAAVRELQAGSGPAGQVWMDWFQGLR